ncbi:MAG: hypothetical protein V4510_07650 [bacterium]
MGRVLVVALLVSGVLAAGCSTPADPSSNCGGFLQAACSPGDDGSTGLLPGAQPAAGTECPVHWHATFAVYVPSDRGADPQQDSPRRIDWSTPATSSGAPYYNYGVDPFMSINVHMHQSRPEQGAMDLGPAQFHFEGKGHCVGIQTAFAAVDLQVTAASLSIAKSAPLQSSNPQGPWQAGDRPLRFFLETKLANGTWTWAEPDLASHLAYQLKDGEAMLLAFGTYSDDAIATMKDSVPRPISRTAPSP